MRILLIFNALFPSGECSGEGSPERSQNTLRFLAASHSSTGPTPSPDQAGSEMQTRHHGAWSASVSPYCGCSEQDLHRQCFGVFTSRGQTIVAGISLFGEVAQHSGFYEFHSCAQCLEVSHCELFAKSHRLYLG